MQFLKIVLLNVVFVCSLQVFTLKFVEVGKVLFTSTVLESTPSHQVINCLFGFCVFYYKKILY